MQGQRELLQSQISANEADKLPSSEPLIYRESVEGTRFIIVGNEETGYFVTFGKYQVSQKVPTIQQAREQVANKDWDIIMAMMAVTVEHLHYELKHKGGKDGS